MHFYNMRTKYDGKLMFSVSLSVHRGKGTTWSCLWPCGGRGYSQSYIWSCLGRTPQTGPGVPLPGQATSRVVRLLLSHRRTFLLYEKIDWSTTTATHGFFSFTCEISAFFVQFQVMNPNVWSGKSICEELGFLSSSFHVEELLSPLLCSIVTELFSAFARNNRVKCQRAKWY